MEHYTSQNEIKEKEKSIIDSSGKFKLVIKTFKTCEPDSKDRTWDFTEGIVYKQPQGSNEFNQEIGRIQRNYSHFVGTFIETPEKDVYLISGRSYMSTTILCLTKLDENGKALMYDNTDDKDRDEFVSVEHHLSLDGKTLVVCGCYWGGPYFHRFYDFSEPLKGLKELEIDEKGLRYREIDWDQKCSNNQDGSITLEELEKWHRFKNKDGKEFELSRYDIYEYEEENGKINHKDIIDFEKTLWKVTFIRENDFMKMIDLWKSERQIKFEEDDDSEDGKEDNDYKKEQLF